MKDLFTTLQERGFIQQVSDEPGIRAYLEKPAFAYTGFDPTADSLHVGHLIPVMALAHVQKAGHTPIAIVGGGTALIGDPSGKTEMRKMLSREEINRNILGIKKQISNVISFEDNSAVMLDNSEWLTDLNYIDFLRETGRHFSVNRMIAAESYKQRLETGLSFIEFNYMILQAYDFLMLSGRLGCLLQMGGNDQWGNIVAGIDLIRRVEAKEAYGITYPLITTASGAKMGKTAKGAVWLDPERTSPYDFYQFWRNTEDADVSRFLSLFTFVPMDEIGRLAQLQGEELNEAKKILAYEATKIIHGEAAAGHAADWKSNMPEIAVSKEMLDSGLTLSQALVLTEKIQSKSEAMRLIKQGGAYLNNQRITDPDTLITADMFENSTPVLRAGKKNHFRLIRT